MSKVFFLFLFVAMVVESSIAQEQLVMSAEQTNRSPIMAKVKPKGKNVQSGERYQMDWIYLQARTVSTLEGYKQKDVPIGRYGDRTDISLKKTGFFYTKKIDGKWWVVSPDGHPMIHVGVTSINLKYRNEDNPVKRIRNSFEEKYGTKEKWAEDAISLLKRYEFNGAGCWADEEQMRAYNQRHDQPVSYVAHLSLLSDYRKTIDKSRGYHTSEQELFPIFEKGFEDYCASRAAELVAYKDDPNLFGYSFDNELEWARDLLDTYLTLPENDPGYRAAKNWLAERSLRPEGPFNDVIRDQFRAYVLDHYLSVASKAIRKVDPNHMLLGSRFYWNDGIYYDHNQSGMFTNPLVFETAGKYVDIFQCNYYYRWTPVSKEINAWTEWSGKPFMITEWYVKGDDTNMENKSGAGWIVATQKDRGLFYQNFSLQLLESPNCVGWDWFRYQDKKGSNRGIVDYDFELYPEILKWMKEINSQVYSLRDHF